jgi:hypothetical protein
MPNGRWSAQHVGAELGTVNAFGESRDAAIEKLRGELRYRLELCPCTGEVFKDLEVEVVEV